MSTVREVKEGLQYQHANASIIYTLDMALVGSDGTPTSPVVEVLDEDGWTDVTATVMPTNSPTISTTIITLSPLASLTLGSTYRVNVQCVVDGNTIVPYFRVQCER